MYIDWTKSGVKELPAKNDRHQTGKAGEELARRYLEENGYRICAVNWRGRRGELDVVAEKDGWLIIVEVRTKRTERFGAVREAVDGRKRRQILRVAEEYVMRQRLSEMPVRIDCIFVDWQGDRPVVEHVMGVFS